MINERTRREGKRLAIELYQFAGVIGAMLGDSKEHSIYEFFPQYFTEEEIQETEQQKIVNGLLAGFARTNANFERKQAEEAKKDG